MEGYDAKFVPPLEKRLECPICLLAQRDPMQTPCGHRFCSPCILRALRETGPRCPVDNTKVALHQLFKDNFARREVLSLTVRCPGEERGCKWEGELRELLHHSKDCELVTAECPNSCGHSCQRNALLSHLLECPSKPRECSLCSVHFPCQKMDEHAAQCCKMKLPESVLTDLFKANEVLKWCGTLKLKLGSQQYLVSGYLSVKSESDESLMYTGKWCNVLTTVPITPDTARVFWRLLHGSEVQTHHFNFSLLLPGDSSSSVFLRLLKKKIENKSNAVCLNLKPGPQRPDLTVIYFHWSEQKKRVLACVAELKDHLVRQIQAWS